MSTSDAHEIGYTPLTGHRRTLLICAVMLGALIQVLDMTIANVALPHMQASLGATPESIGWVLTSYIVAAGIFIPITGWMADRIGQRRLFLIVVAGFVIASMLCGLARSLGAMVLFRILQGLAGASLAPLAQTVMLDNTPPEKRGQVMAIFGMGVMIGPVIGPILGGVLTEQLNWRWVFFVNVPLGILCLMGLWVYLPERKRPPRPFDGKGFLLLASGIGALQLMLDRGQHVDWFSSWEIRIELVLAISAFWMCGIHFMTAKNPLYQTDMMRNTNLMVATLFMFIMGFLLMGTAALLPIMLQEIFGYPVIQAGLLMATRGVGTMLTMLLIGRAIHHIDMRILITSGMAIIGLAVWQMTGWTMDIDASTVAVNGLFQGLGIGMLFVPINIMAFWTLRPEFRTDGSGILNLSRSLGSSIGISVLVAMLANNAQVSHADLSAYITPARLGIDPTFLMLPGNATTAAMALIDQQIIRQATLIAFLNDYRILLLITILSMPTILLIRRPPASLQHEQSEDDGMNATMAH